MLAGYISSIEALLYLNCTVYIMALYKSTLSIVCWLLVIGQSLLLLINVLTFNLVQFVSLSLYCLSTVIKSVKFSGRSTQRWFLGEIVRNTAQNLIKRMKYT